MKAPEDKGGARIKCLQCTVSLEIPYLRGILVNVPAEQAVLVNFAVSAGKSGSAHGSAPGIPTLPPAKHTQVDEWLKEASNRKDAGDFEGAIKLLQLAYDHIKKENALYPIDTFVRLPLYFQQAGRAKEAWQEFNKLLFGGYPNQPKDMIRVPLDRAHILDKMRLFLDRDGKTAIGAVYDVLSQVCEAISLHRDEKRRREVRPRFSKTVCNALLGELKQYPGHLGNLQEVRSIIIEELGLYPELDFERLGSRIDVVFANKATVR
jgi:hypothetical protein